MGEKRVSKRTLDSGETVLHHPPDEAHPDGKLVLVRDGSALQDRLAARRESQLAQQGYLNDVSNWLIAGKKHKQTAKGLPPEKSPI